MCKLRDDQDWPCILPDKSKLYRYCKPEALPEDQKEIPSGLFTDGELSCDLAELIKVEDVKFVAKFKYHIIEITVNEEIRNACNPKNQGNMQPEWHQTIRLDPIPDNKAHALIIGKKKLAVRDNIAKSSKLIRTS